MRGVLRIPHPEPVFPKSSMLAVEEKHYCLHFADNAEAQLLEHFMCPKTVWFVSMSLRTLLFMSHSALEKMPFNFFQWFIFKT